jgi:hypothetical protein
MDDDQKELIKAGAEAVFKPFSNLIERLFGGAADEVGLMLKNEVMVRRIGRERILLEKVQRMLDDAEIEPNLVPDKIWIPLLQAAATEDDDALQEQFAALLANAAGPCQSDVSTAFVETLRQLSREEALLLKRAYEVALDFWKKENGKAQIRFGIEGMMTIAREALGSPFDPGDFPFWLDNLQRLGVLRMRTDMQFPRQEPLTSSMYDTGGIEAQQQHSYYISDYGIRFMAACTAPKKQSA